MRRSSDFRVAVGDEGKGPGGIVIAFSGDEQTREQEITLLFAEAHDKPLHAPNFSRKNGRV